MMLCALQTAIENYNFRYTLILPLCKAEHVPERMTVNHDVTGSSPVRGAKHEKSEIIACRQWFRISFAFVKTLC